MPKRTCARHARMPHNCISLHEFLAPISFLTETHALYSANTTGLLVHIGNKTYAACDTYRDCAEMNGGRLINECSTRSLPNGTTTAKVKLCVCLNLAGLTPRGDEGPCYTAKCNVGPKTCLTRHAEGYFNLVSAGW